MRADRLAPRQLPATCRITEGLGCQSTDRTQINHVAGKLGINGATNESLNLGMHVPVDHAEFHHPGDFLTETDTARAMDATRHLLHRNQGAGVLMENDTLRFVIARCIRAITDRQILQLAFATLIANRAIERVIDQEKLHHALLRGDRQFRMRKNLHARSNRRRTCRQCLRCFLDLHQAHPATSRNRELLVIAEVRDIGTRRLRRIHDGAASGHLHRFAVDFDIKHSH